MTRTANALRAADATDMFAFFSSNLGCVGSVVVSVVVTLLIIFLTHGCSGGATP